MKVIDNYRRSREAFAFRTRVGMAVAAALVVLCGLLGRLAWLQLARGSEFAVAAESNRTVTVPITPSRGVIRDRNGVILAENHRAWSLEITPGRTGGRKTDDVIAELATVIDIAPSDIRRFKKQREEARQLESSVIRSRLTDAELARFVAQRWRFPGVEAVPQEYRVYPRHEAASHVIGYIGRISRSDQKEIAENGEAGSYRGLRSMGKVGVERSYEATLRGEPGREINEVTASGRPVRLIGITGAERGRDLELSIDINLQRIAEEALGSDMGAAIAIEPSTGEILAFVSTPTYDPNLFPEGIDQVSWDELSGSPSKPLLNRAARGLYPIGSTYKPFVALAGLHYGVITPATEINDTGTFEYHGRVFRDASRLAKGRMNLHRSIMVSSDVYYYWLASVLGINRMYPYMKEWGFGELTGIDLVGEQKGTLPNPEWKEKRFRQRWFPGDTVNLGIGQGYNQFTLLQLANAVSTLANRGTMMTPHLVRRVVDPADGSGERLFTTPKKQIFIPDEHLNAVIDAMADVTRRGTARRVFAGAPYRAAGKTGTAQVITIAQDKRYDAAKLARRHHDHGLFICFAPYDRPQVAIAVLRENGGFGAEAAAPVAKAMLDYWLTGENRLGLPPPPHVAKAAAEKAKKPAARRRKAS